MADLRPLFWASFIFFLAFLNLCARISSFGATTSLITDGITFFAKTTNGSVVTRDCTDVWSCPVAICEIKKTVNLTSVNVAISPPTSDRGSACGAQGISWIWEFGYARAAVMFLIMACLFQALGPICGMWNKVYRYVFITAGYVFLTGSYIFEFIWTLDYAGHRHDYQPEIVKGWNIALSVFLILGAGVANIWYLGESSNESNRSEEPTVETPLQPHGRRDKFPF